MHAQIGQDVVGVGEHIHQVRNGRALVARHIRHPGLQQGLGHRQYALALEGLAFAEPEFLDLLFE